MANSIRRDAIYGWRSLWRSPGLTGAIILSLAIVIGANATIFGLVDAMFLRRLPLPNAAELAAIRPVSDGRPISLPYAQYRVFKASAGVPPIEAYRFEGATAATDAGEHTDLWIDLVTGGYFQLLGVKPVIGRVLDAQDERAAARVAVVSEEFWTRYLGRRPDVLGRTLHLNDMTFTLVGVTPVSFTGIHFARRFQVAIPFTVSPTGFPDPDRLGVTMIARLDGRRPRPAQIASVDAAFRSCCLDAMGSTMQRDGMRASTLNFVAVGDPPTSEMSSRSEGAGAGVHLMVRDASRGVTWSADFRERYRGALLATAAAVLLLLLIACANVATLFLARGESREREFAIRRSLGATAARIRIQLFIEGLEVAFAGSVLGFCLAALGTNVLLSALPPSAANLGEAIAWRPSASVIAFTISVMVVCALATSVWPARRAAREELLASLAGVRRRVAGNWGADRVLVVAQIALAVVLLTVAGLFVSTVRNVTRFEGGYRTRDALLAQVNARTLMNDESAMQALYADLARELGALPGAESAAFTYNAPILQDGLMQTRVQLVGSNQPEPIPARFNMTSTGFFAASGIGLAAGRDFVPGDAAGAEGVVIVSQAFERRYYGRSAIGSTVMIGKGPTARVARIVGVARDARFDRMAGLGTDLRNVETEMMYQPIAQMSHLPPVLTVIVRTLGDPLALAPAVRRLVEQRPGIRLARVTGVGQLLDDAASRERFSAALASAFGIIALMLAGVGVFGVLAFQVARRTPEIGIRMALGARPFDAVFLILRQSLVTTAVATAIGVPLAYAGAWALRAQFYGVGPADPFVLLGSVALLSAITVAASVIPSRRATRVDPLVALRGET